MVTGSRHICHQLVKAMKKSYDRAGLKTMIDFDCNERLNDSKMILSFLEWGFLATKGEINKKNRMNKSRLRVSQSVHP